MRTTLTIDDDVLRVARSMAREQRRSLGEVISELARRGLEPRDEIRYEADFPVFRVAEDAPPLTPEMVERARDDG